MDLEKLKLDDDFLREMKASMNIFDEEKFKKALIAIARRSAEVVGATVGPYANTVIVGDGYTHYPTKDGWGVLRQLSFNSPMYQELFGLFKEVSYTLAHTVGDGTSTAVIAADTFINEMVSGTLSDRIAKYRQSDFINTLNQMVNELSDILTREARKNAIDVNGDFSDLEKVAYISSNGNDEVAEVIKKVYQETKNPNIYVALGDSDKIEYEVEKGFKLQGETIAIKAYINNDEGTYKPTLPCIYAILDHNMTWGEHSQFINLLNDIAANKRRPVVLIAPGYDDITATALRSSFEKTAASGGTPVITVFTVPLSMEAMRKSLSDFAILVGAHIIDRGRIKAFTERRYLEGGGTLGEDEKIASTVYDELDEFKNLTSVQLIEQCLGGNTNTTIGEKYIMIKDYNTESDQYKANVAEAEQEYLEAKKKIDKSATAYDADYQRASSRYNRLTGTMGTIKVGAASAVAQRCLKDSVDDAVLACKSAFNYGYVKGMNVTTLRAIEELHRKYDEGSIEDLVLSILYRSMIAPSMKVLENKYGDPYQDVIEVAGEMLNSHDIMAKSIQEDLVFNLLTDSFESNEDISVIQSVQTDIEVLKALASILGLILTSSYMISTNQVYDRKDIELIQRDEALDLFADKIDIIADKLAKAVVDVIIK